MGIPFQMCFTTEGCTWEPMGLMGGECVPDEGGGDGGNDCALFPVAICGSVPGCVVDGDECVEE
jgi:hypothetical protein